MARIVNEQQNKVYSTPKIIARAAHPSDLPVCYNIPVLTLHLLTSFLAGGIFIALQTLAGERVQGFWRGVVLTIPSTIAIGLLFIGLTKSPHDVTEAALIIPAALGADYLYVAVFAALTRSGLAARSIISLMTWALAAGIILRFPPRTFAASAFFYGLPMILVSYAAVRALPQLPHLKKFPMTVGQILFRSLLGGSIIALIVIFANTFGNTWGGLFTAFPAAFTATFVIYYQLHGAAAIPAIAKSLFFPGSIGFMVYAWAAAAAFPLWGIWFGTLAAYLATFVFFAIFYIISHAKTAR